jgi:SOS-response transcriptional repressor LexA
VVTSNSQLVAQQLAPLKNIAMNDAKKPKRKPLEEWQKRDAERLRVLWDERGKTLMSQEAFGERYGIGGQSAVWQYLSGTIALNPETAERFARGLNVQVIDFSPRIAEQITQMARVAMDTHGETSITLAHVPVVGTAQLGDQGFWLELGHPVGIGDGSVRFPVKDQNAYAVRVVGDSMHPRIKSGEFVIVEPNHAYAPGDEVLVVTKNGRSMVKEFLYQRDGIIALNSVNDGHGRMTLQEHEIEKIHYIAGIAKSALHVLD